MTDQGPRTAAQPPDEGPPQGGVDLADLKRKSVRGGMVTMLSQGISIAIQLASTVILARLLTPEDYGTIAMVLAVTAFAGLFRDLGLSSAAIQKKDLTDAQQSNLFWLNVAMGAALTAIVAAASPLVAWFYGKPELTAVTLALSASFLIGSLGAQHTARLIREMQFARKAAATIAGALVTLAVSVVLAWQGWSYWSLVWANLAGAAVTTLLFLLLSPFWPGWYKKGAGIRGMLGFGANVTGFNFLNYFHRNLDNILIGRVWGTEALGLYSKAYSLLMLPINAIRGPINAVAFPALSKLQGQPEAFRAYYRRITSLLAFVTMPLVAFLFLASSPLIEIALGPKWLGVSPIFSILAITAFIQPVAGLRGLVLLSTGQGRRYMMWGVFNAVCVCIGFGIGVAWGATGVAISYAIVNYAILYPSLQIAFEGTSLRPGDFFMPLLLPASVSLIAAILSHITVKGVCDIDAYSAWIEISSIGLVYGATCLIFLAALPAGRHELRRIPELLLILRDRQKKEI